MIQDIPNLHLVCLPAYEVRRIVRTVSKRYRSIRTTRKARQAALRLVEWLTRCTSGKREIESIELKAPELTWRRLGVVLAEAGAADLTAEICKQIADVD